MFKKTITFKDLDGNSITEDFYFHMSPAELMEAESTFEGGFSDHLRAIIKTQDGGKVFVAMKDILSKAIGRRSDDGRRFIKNQEIIDDFFQSDAYTELILEWLKNPQDAVDAFNAMLPDNLDQIAEEMERNGKTLEAGRKENLPAWYTEGRVPTEAELMSAPRELVAEAFKRKNAQPQS